MVFRLMNGMCGIKYCVSAPIQGWENGVRSSSRGATPGCGWAAPLALPNTKAPSWRHGFHPQRGVANDFDPVREEVGYGVFNTNALVGNSKNRPAVVLVFLDNQDGLD